MRLIKLSIIGVFLALASPAVAQSGCGGQFPANQFCGAGGSQGLPGPRLIPAGGTTPIGGGTVIGNNGTVNALPSALTAPVLGIPGTSVGSIAFGNLTSGTVKLQPTTGALASSILTLPAITDTLAGFALANGGTNANLTASNGGIFWSNATQAQILAGTATARQMLQSGTSAAPAWSTATWPATTTINQILYSSSANTVAGLATANGGIVNTNASGVPAVTNAPVVGVPGASTGTLGFGGITSGTATITPQATAGTPTLTLPNTSGTLADGASTPLVLSATTGNLTCPGCVTSSGGGAITGTAPVAVSAAGVVSITGAAGQVLAGASPAFTATPVLGVAGSTVGTIGFQNATSGTVTLSPATGALGAVTATLPANTGTIAETNLAQTWSAVQSHNANDLVANGSSSGSTVINAPATGGGTATFFPGTDTIAGIAATQTFTNKTIASSTDILGGVTMTLGSDATGDIYYRAAGGALTRLGIGSSTNVLTVSGGLPAWTAAAGGGNVSNSGTPTANQLAQWVTATTVQGVNVASVLTQGSGISITGTTNATIAQSLGNATLQSGVLTPTGTGSATSLMMGMGSTCKITPVYSGRVLVTFSGTMLNSIAGAVSVATAHLRFGTGSIPANAAAVAGSTIGTATQGNQAIANGALPFSNSGIVTGQAVGTQLWFDEDLSQSSGTGTASLSVACTLMEF